MVSQQRERPEAQHHTTTRNEERKYTMIIIHYINHNDAHALTYIAPDMEAAKAHIEKTTATGLRVKNAHNYIGKKVEVR